MLPMFTPTRGEWGRWHEVMTALYKGAWFPGFLEKSVPVSPVF